MADVTTTFAAKDESFAKTVDNLNSRLQGFQGQTEGFSQRVASLAGEFAKFAVPIAGVAAAFFGAKGAVTAFSDAIRIGGELADLANRTGESAGELAVLQRAFENAGMSGSDVGQMLNRLQRFMIEASEGGKTQTEAMAKLGLSYDQLKEKSPSEQMQILAQRIAAIEDPAQRTAVSMEIFGRSGGALVPLLRAMGDELDTARRQLGSYPEVIDRTNQALDTIGDNFNAISTKTREFATGLMSKLAPGLAEITSKIAEIDAAGFGMMLADYFDKTIRAAAEAYKLGSAIDSVKVAIEAITSGNFSEGLSLMWVTMKVTALNSVNEIVSNFMAGFMTVRDFIAEMFASGGALAHLISTMGDIVGNKLISTIGTALAAMVESLGPAFENVAESIRYNAETAAQQVEMLTFGMGAQFELVAEQAGAAGRAMPENFEQNKASLQPLFDLTPALKEQDALHQSIKDKLASIEPSTAAMAASSETYAKNLESANSSLATSTINSSQIALNLQSASIAAQSIPPAFDLSTQSSEKIRFDLESTAEPVENVEGWLGEGAEHTEQMSIHGKSVEQSGQNFAGSIAAARIDAKATSDLFEGLADRMNQAVQNTNSMLDKMREAFAFAKQTQDEITKQRKLEEKTSLAERERDRKMARADDMEKRGYWRSADRLRQKAEAEYTKKLEKLRPELEKATEAAKRALAEGGGAADRAMSGGGSSARDAIKAGASDAASAMKEAASSIRDALGDKEQSKLALESTLSKCREFLANIDKKLPQNSLS